MEYGDFIIMLIVIILLSLSSTFTFDTGAYQGDIVHLICQAATRYILDGGYVGSVSLYELERTYPSLQQITLPGGDHLRDWYEVKAVTMNYGLGLGNYEIQVLKFRYRGSYGQYSQTFICNNIDPVPQGTRMTIEEFFGNTQ